MRLTISGTYPDDWKEIAARVRREAGSRCIRCGHPDERPSFRVPCDNQCRHPNNGKQRMLTVHHLDGDKSNCRWWNLLALCQVCHLSIQARVIPERPWLLYHSPWFRVYVAGYYAYAMLGVELEREEVERTLPALLATGQPWLSYDNPAVEPSPRPGGAA